MPQGTLVRLFHHGPGRALGHRMLLLGVSPTAMGLLMLSLVVVAIMLELSNCLHADGHGRDLHLKLAYERDTTHTGFDGAVSLQGMTNDVLIAIPFSSSWAIWSSAPPDQKLFKSMHLAMARVPGSLAIGPRW